MRRGAPRAWWRRESPPFVPRWRSRAARVSACRSARPWAPCSSRGGRLGRRWPPSWPGRPRERTPRMPGRRGRVGPLPELRKDPVVGRWVIIATERAHRPSDFEASVDPRTCPFCPGNEAQTPSEILSGRVRASCAEGPGWTYRVVPKKFPALRIDGGLEPAGEGLFARMNGVGVHEGIIESPDHGAIHTRSSSPRPSSPSQRRRSWTGRPTTTGAGGGASGATCWARSAAPRGGSSWRARGFVAQVPYAPRFPCETWIMPARQDRKSTRLNSSHLGISYAVFCLKKKKKKNTETHTKKPTHSIQIH